MINFYQNDPLFLGQLLGQLVDKLALVVVTAQHLGQQLDIGTITISILERSVQSSYLVRSWYNPRGANYESSGRRGHLPGSGADE